MKFKLLALTMCALILSSASVQAKNAKVFTSKSAKKAHLLSKSMPNTTFFGAEDTSTISLTGPTGVWTPLPFTMDQLSNGTSITPNGASNTFLLAKGTYFISFTGTFADTGGDTAFYDIALQLGTNVIFINTDSQETVTDNIGISTIYKVIEVDTPTNLSIVTRVTSNAGVDVTTRSITIEQFE
jgi:hypothetical protein